MHFTLGGPYFDEYRDYDYAAGVVRHARPDAACDAARAPSGRPDHAGAGEDRTEGDAPSPSPTTEGLVAHQRRSGGRFFSRFPAIVLVANSDEVDLPAVRAR